MQYDSLQLENETEKGGPHLVLHLIHNNSFKFVLYAMYQVEVLFTITNTP